MRYHRFQHHGWDSIEEVAIRDIISAPMVLRMASGASTSKQLLRRSSWSWPFVDQIRQVERDKQSAEQQKESRADPTIAKQFHNCSPLHLPCFYHVSLLIGSLSSKRCETCADAPVRVVATSPFSLSQRRSKGPERRGAR